jgi:hypothetical protein
MKKAKPSVSARPNEMAIFERLLSGGAEMTPALARYLLALRFPAEDEARMHELAEKNQEGSLSAEGKEELLAYARAGCLLGIFQSRARKTLKKTPAHKVS